MTKFMTLLTALLLACNLAAAKEYDIGRDSNKRNAPLKLGKVTEGQIIQVRNVTIEPTSTAKTTGRAIGAVTGAGVGRALRKKGWSVPALGGLIGGVVGNQVTDKAMRVTAQELIIKLPNNDVMVLTQAESNLAVGQVVYLVRSAGKTRAIRKEY